ncbi:hypothetical protein BO94DRAFT_18192 [Aspergillus sclerotioniger CBS 115572]|uniref:Uncharacterized protein n=1 Tax=Aspergillus sclerotioniger CBS 115572 TaxID=1450535 RepID=A0A317XES7_9EURO|nr:hypothetical protein BO94DRAFT_18192 [Aspergillus sclerotioniger CBS 115572]PWY96721.1 hypothetical protein BO94DRAFT_18192 [Aspergillus sclerotioniger CBS 115572]
MEAETAIKSLRAFLGNTDMNPEAEEELANLWTDIDCQISKLSSHLSDIEGNRGATLGRLKTHCEEQTKNHPRSQKVVMRFVKVLETLNSIAGDSASGAFPGASACFKGLAILVAGIQNYANLPEELGKLADACMRGLENIQGMYVNAGLAIKIHRRFALIVQICCECANATQSRKYRLKRAVEKTFGDDKIKALMDELSELREDQVESVVNDLHRVTFSTDAERKWRRSLVKALDFHPGELGPNEEPMKSSLGMLYRPPFENTGKWIDSNESFQAWLDGSQTTICLLVAPAGYGKSYLMANLTNRLPPSKARGLVAFYFHEKMDLTPSMVDSAGLVRQAVRSIIWQCAVDYSPLLKSMAPLIQEYGSPEQRDPIELWTRLLVDNDERKRMDHVIFVLIDCSSIGIAAFLPLIRTLNRSRDHKIRLMLTASPDDLLTLSQGDNPSVAKVDLGHHSKPDIAVYATSRMNQMASLGRETNPTVQLYRKKILKELQEKSGGDWLKVTTTLDYIARMETNPGKIDEILNGLTNSRETTTVNLIAELNRQLDSDQIRELNAAIVCITHGFRLWTPEEMDEILRLGYQKDWFCSFRERMRWYPLLDLNPAGYVTWQSPDIPEGIPKRSELELERDVRSAEIDIVHHFLRQVCPEALFRKLEFDTFLEGKRIGTMNPDHLMICKDESNAHIRMALICLQILTTQQAADSLIQYAGKNLLRHLKCTGLSQVAPDLKRQAGRLLAELFTSSKGIKTMFWINPEEKMVGLLGWIMGEGRGQQQWLRAICDDWLNSDRGGNLLASWFKDPVVTADIVEQKQMNLVSAFCNSSDTRYELLFKAISENIMLELCIAQSHEAILTGMEYLTAFIRRISKPQLPLNTKPSNQESEARLPTLTEWLMVDEYYQPYIRTIDSTNPPSVELMNFKAVYHARIAASIDLLIEFKNIGEMEMTEAIRIRDERLSEALNIMPECILALRIQFRHERNSTKALELIDRLISSVKKEVDGGLEAGNAIIASLVLEKGNRYWELGPEYHNRAIAAYNDMWKYGFPLEPDPETMMNNIYKLNEPSGVFWDLIRQMNSSFEKWKRHVAQAWLGIFGTEAFKNLARKAVLQKGSLGLLVDLLRQAWESAAAQGDVLIRCEFTLCCASIYLTALRRFPSDAEATANIIDNLERSLQLNAAQPQYTLKPREANEADDILAELYLRQAIANNSNQDWGQRFEQFMQRSNHTKSRVVSCCFARYVYMTRGVPQAKAAVQELLKMALEMLSDKDPCNDGLAFSFLSRIMVTFGDLENTKVIGRIFHLIRLSWWTASEKEAADMKVDASAVIAPYTCTWCGEDANNTSVLDLRSCYLCVDCAGTVSLHGKCYEEWRKLGPHAQPCHGHQFLFIPEMYVTPLVNTLVPTEPTVISLSEWKDGLRKKYLE